MKCDVVVLGAGIVGVCVAAHLQKKGRNVVLLDRRGPGSETSFGNAGLIQREAIYPYGFPHDFGALARYAVNRTIDATPTDGRQFHPRLTSGNVRCVPSMIPSPPPARRIQLRDRVNW